MKTEHPMRIEPGPLKHVSLLAAGLSWLDQLRDCYGLLLREHTRQLDYIFFTLLFPCLFFLIFGVPEGTDFWRANTLLASFSAFGVIGVVLFQLAVISAQERHSHWQGYLRSLPLAGSALLTARVLMVISFSLLSILSIYLTAAFGTQLDIDPWTLLKFVACLLLGALPFALIGYLVGSFASPKGVVPLANLVYLSLSYVGGLWFPPQLLHPTIQAISVHLPSRHYVEILWDIT
ncbi:MAG: hypothetical protein CVV27_19630, partial [Candidatus Melainabacteria bacterium HGW-Melainabacteria-1]